MHSSVVRCTWLIVSALRAFCSHSTKSNKANNVVPDDDGDYEHAAWTTDMLHAEFPNVDAEYLPTLRQLPSVCLPPPDASGGANYTVSILNCKIQVLQESRDSLKVFVYVFVSVQ